MNGLVLPIGSKQPLRGDASHHAAPLSPVKLDSSGLASLVKTEGSSPTQRAFGGAANVSRASLTSPTSSSSVSSVGSSGPNALRSALSTSSNTSAAALAFIPRTSRNSAAVQKPIHLCSEFELEQRLDRNERILSTLEATQSPTKDRLRLETEAIRDVILSLRAMRDVNDGISSVDLKDPTKEAELESALLGLSVKDAAHLGTSPPSDAFGWSRDTVAVKKKLAQSSGAYHPGRKVQAMGYEQSLAIQSAALLAERERERLKSTPAPRERPSLGVPSGAAHRLGRKSISSCSGSMRKNSSSHSISPPKATRAGGPLARNLDRGPQHDAALEGGESDQDDAGLYDMPDDEEDDEDAHPGPRHEDDGFSFGQLDQEDP
ncbi:hypothetical protein PHSY_006878 [Pseudozyma hubeiensis SY62]|uniref:Uncharacterized protein n=1 Tax=Pseudozyma hubeiensis (strain SY62) TaxID=1305764 RepID=R9PDG0_PSEHS|nr:hypothetical protein PHSY_006878 [Pseudozyma hubeiensis SY62]GAC99277.1 hypothetical protein PHSY_006878 [Pseudozyma hubeiensis SY62]